MDAESGDDDKDGLTSGWGGESRQDWLGWRNESWSWFQRQDDAYLKTKWEICDFYRATHMHSADYAVARCLSVCHTPALCLNDYRYPQSFSLSGNPTILVIFHTKRDANIPTGTPLTGAPNARGQGYEKITIFDQYLADYSCRKYSRQKSCASPLAHDRDHGHHQPEEGSTT